MKQKDFDNLKIGDVVIHKHYRKSKVVGFIPDFGPTIIPCFFKDRVLLSRQTGMHPNTPLLETSKSLIQLQ